jgi:hypothetical protein
MAFSGVVKADLEASSGRLVGLVHHVQGRVRLPGH